MHRIRYGMGDVAMERQGETMPHGHRTGRHGKSGGSRRRFAPRIRRDIARKDGVAASFAIIGWVCYIASALLLSWVVGALIHNDMIARTVADNVATAPSTWPAGDRKAAYDRAREYNGRLEAQFGGRIPADAASETGPARETLDSVYMTTLSVDGKGAMARLNIPQISVNIPIYHTTLDSSLDDGAGHIYGTALPVGDPHTYSALAAHSGGVQGMLFTRLNELHRGAVFYIDVLGGEQGYRVTDIRTIKPEQMERTLQDLRRQYGGGEATVTLVTCTPIGVNTDRLLVTGVRENIPESMPPASTQKDTRLIAACIGIALFVLLLALALLVTWLRRRRTTKHS